MDPEVRDAGWNGSLGKPEMKGGLEVRSPEASSPETIATEGDAPQASGRIRAVMFDFGGVLYRTPKPQHMRRLLRLFGVRDPGPISMVTASPLESPLVMDLMTGRLAEKEMWRRMARELRIWPALLDFLRKSGYSSRRLDRELTVYLSSLRPHYRTAILTNAGSEFRGTFGRAYGLEKMVDQLIISAEEGLAKPDTRLYYRALEQLGVTAEETVFVDDIPENVSAARKAGMQAVLHLDSERTIARIVEILEHGLNGSDGPTQGSRK